VTTSGLAKVTDCWFEGNEADPAKGYGGGLSIWCSTPGAGATVNNCTFVGNSAMTGGGVQVSKYTDATLINCTFCGNDAGAGAGVGLYYANSVRLVNCVIAHSTRGEAFAGNGTKVLDHCNLFGNAGGDWVGDIAGQLGMSGNICLDPLFVDATRGDCHLRYDSPCRDAGNNSTPGLPGADCEGDPRIAHGTVDMGADEFHTHLYCTGEFTPGGAVEVKLVGLPGSAPVGIFLSTGVMNPPLQTMWGLFHLQLPYILLVLTPIPSSGVMVLSTTLPASIPAPYDLPMQAMVGNELTNLYILHVR
jgi:hypothetical protein